VITSFACSASIVNLAGRPSTVTRSTTFHDVRSKEKLERSCVATASTVAEPSSRSEATA
jgi:hypothetical protein